MHKSKTLSVKIKPKNLTCMNPKKVLQKVMLENLKCMSQKVILKPLKVKKNNRN